MGELPDPIESAIAALEAQRSVLGDAVTEMAIAPLREKLAAARQAARANEQRLRAVTVLFMDVAGSTDLSEKLDPEDVHAAMDGVLQRATAVVHAHRGKVLSYAGDGLLAAFGVEEAHEDDAARSVRAGLAIIEEARLHAAQLRERLGQQEFRVRVGINTGPVLLGSGVDAQISIRGVTVNIAARMEQTAPPGSLRISHDTYRHVRGMFDVSVEPPITVKGIAEPIRSYLVARAKPRAFRVTNRGIEGVTTGLIGRVAEFATLTDAYKSVVEGRKLVFVSLVGDAGLGKSRLLLEFEEWLELRTETVWSFQGRADPGARNLPYALLRDIFAWRFEIHDSDSLAVAKAKLAQGFGTLFADRAEEQTALLGQLIGLDYSDSPHIAGILRDGRQIRDRACHAAAQYFRLLQQDSDGPIVLLLDDLHWTDDGSLDFIDQVMRACSDVPMLVLGLTRPLLYERRPRWGESQSNQQRIDLCPLSQRSSRDLVEALLSRLEAVPAAVRDLLTGSAEGNPYFIEELLGMLIDNGVIVTHTPADPERWQIVPDKLLDVKVPPTLTGLLQARLDGLPSPEKTALQQASVIGYVFWDEPLERIEVGASEALVALTSREFAQKRQSSTFEDAREYAFKHQLLHQVTYDSVLKRHKREQHRLIAEWLVARSGERASEYYGLIAEHYERAGDVANAVNFLRKAGEDAAKFYANVTALGYFGRALALIPESESENRFALLVSRVSVFSNTGQRREQEDDIASLERLAEVMNDDIRRARAAGCRASHAVATGDYRAAAVAAERAVAWAAAAGDPGAALLACLDAARALLFQGDPAAQTQTEHALALSRQVGNHWVETAALNQLGILHSEAGRCGLARDYYQQSLQKARATGDRALEGAVLTNLGDSERYLGNYRLALEPLEAGLNVFREIGQRMGEAYALCNLASVALARGEISVSLTWAEKAVALARQVNDRDLEATILCIRGDALAALGNADEASAAYRDSLAIYREIGRPTMLPEPLAGLARIALARGATAEALASVAEIVAYFDSGGNVDATEDPFAIYLTCYQSLAGTDPPRAAAWLTRAHDQLMERAGALEGAERAGFLGNVASHRAIMTAWEETRR